jgi:hypothetical protein
MDFIPNNSIYNNELKCIGTILAFREWEIGGGNAQQ